MSSEKSDPAAMAESVSSMPSYLTEHEKRVNDEYEWAINDPEVRRQYGGQVVAVYQRRIWGAGPNHSVALDTALQQPGAPPRYFFALPVVPYWIPTASDSADSET